MHIELQEYLALQVSDSNKLVLQCLLSDVGIVKIDKASDGYDAQLSTGAVVNLNEIAADRVSIFRQDISWVRRIEATSMWNDEA